jgi:2,4-dienoyl-CoA reductase-like NADH-dependent reductase (Old Yellow Enzyme family)
MRFPLAVVAAVKRTIAGHADRPFALGYRISVEESGDGGLKITDSLELITRLIAAGASYIHASLGSALDQKPATGGRDATIVSILRDHIAGRVPLIAAGRIKTPQQAESAMDMGLSLVAVGQGLVVNPDWMADARIGRESDIHLSVSAGDVVPASIPHKLWAVIGATLGWFNVIADDGF